MSVPGDVGSLWDTVCVALVDALRALPTMCGPQDDPAGRVQVFDGVQLFLTEQDADAWVAVRWPGDDRAGIGDAGGAGQAVRTLGRVQRDETGSIRCRVMTRTGEADLAAVPAQWAAAWAVVREVEQVLRADPRVGVLSAPALVVEFASVDSAQQWLSDGVLTSIDFTLSYRGRV